MNAVQEEIRAEAARVREALRVDPRAYAQGIGSLDNLALLALKLAETPEPVPARRLRRRAAA